MKNLDAEPWWRVLKMAKHAIPEHVTPEDTSGVRRFYYTVLDRKARVRVKAARILDVEVHCNTKHGVIWRRVQPDGAFGLRLVHATRTHISKEQTENGNP